MKKEASKIVDGRTYYWCCHHKDSKNQWDGMYVRHTECNHAEEMKKQRTQRDKSNSGPSDANQEGGGSKLVVSHKLKEVLCSHLMISDADAHEMCNEVGQLKD